MEAIRADDIIDRQRLRRKLSFWRIAAIVCIFAAILLIVGLIQFQNPFSSVTRDHIAHVKIQGTITEDENLLDRLGRIAENDQVKGVIVTISSPGGTTSGGEAIYEAVRKIAEEKPVVAQVGTMAASAGYMIAAASDQIVARQSSIVGSIGVIFQYPNVEGLLDNLGIDMRAIKSSPLKAEPLFFGETPEGAEEMIQSMISDSFDWFKGIVTERRDFSPAKTDRLADGSVFTGRQALENGLIDQLGGEEVAHAWLTEQGVDENLNILEWERDDKPDGLLFSNSALRWLAAKLGLAPFTDPVANALENTLMLDGLVSVWHVQQN